MQNQHRSGHLRQSNKPFKGFSKKDTKLKLKKRKSNPRSNLKKQAISKVSKSAKKHYNKQKRMNKRNLVLEKRRIGSHTGTPKNIGIFSLCEKYSSEEMKKEILSIEGIQSNGNIIQTIIFKEKRKRITFIKMENNKKSILDSGKICDQMLFITSMKKDENCEIMNDEKKEFIRLLQAQGFPKSIVVIKDFENVKKKKVKKHFMNNLKVDFPSDTKYVFFSSINPQQSTKALIRTLLETSIKNINWRNNRPYLLVNECKFFKYDQSIQMKNDYENNLKELGIEQQQDIQTNILGDLEIRGYLRGKQLSPNQLIHIVNYGTYQIKRMEIINDPYPMKGSVNHHLLYTKKVYLPDKNAENLKEEIIPDPFMAEPGDYDMGVIKDDLMEEDDDNIIKDDDDDDHPSDEENFEGNYGDDENLKQNTGDDENINIQQNLLEDVEIKEFAKSEIETTIGKDFNIEIDDNMTEEERFAQIEQFEELKQKYHEDSSFPDFIRTPDDTLCKVRFQKYRGLDNYRKSEWDPFQSLPLDYSRIFQFENFKQSKKLALKVYKNSVDIEIYVSIVLKDVPQSLLQSFQPSSELMIGVGLLKNEQRMSVTHFLIKKSKSYTEPVKSKDEMYVQIGFRTYKCHPIFSENNLRANKFKCERYLHNDFTVGTIYSHVTFAPSPVLVFRRSVETGKTMLAASGSLMAVDPFRVILKKIILTGHVFRSNKTKSVVRFMFFNPVDVKYFKPIEVYTTGGKRGIIRESLGKHGYMKVQFSDNVQQNQLCCMNLFKRVFPKWDTEFISFL